jgi:peptidoglycan/LPS O-acetylase OafA/YrhL
LRFFASAAIVIFHLKGLLPWDRPAALSQGVAFFFVLSGFILTYVYGGLETTSIRSFYWHRFARLWPVHIVMFAAAALLLPGNSPPSITAANILLVHSWVPIVGWPFSYNAVSWSISVEVAFYLSFPLLARTKYFMVFYAALIAIIACTLLSQDYIEAPQSGAFSPVHLILQNPLTRILEFATGVGAGRLFATSTDMGFKERTWSAIELSVLVVLGVYWATLSATARWLEFHGFPGIGMWYGESAGFLLFALAITVYAYGRGILSRGLAHSWLVRLGEISFSTYMLHQLIIRAYANHAPQLPWQLSVPILLGLIYLCSYLLWQYVEVPARRMIIGFDQRRNGARKLASTG